MAVNQLTVFNINFDSITDFLQVIGYKSKITQKTILDRYGSFESFVKRRYKIDSDEQAKAKLLELMGQKEQPKEQKAYIDDSPVVKCARAFVTACINKGLKDDKNLLDGLMMAFNISDLDAVRAQIDKIKAGL